MYKLLPKTPSMNDLLSNPHSLWGYPKEMHRVSFTSQTSSGFVSESKWTYRKCSTEPTCFGAWLQGRAVTGDSARSRRPAKTSFPDPRARTSSCPRNA